MNIVNFFQAPDILKNNNLNKSMLLLLVWIPLQLTYFLKNNNNKK